MRGRYGENPLGVIRRVPRQWWRQMKNPIRKKKKNADGASLKRGRRKYFDLYPEGMKQRTEELVRYYNETTSRDPPEAPCLSTMINTFNSIVKRYNFDQKLQRSNRVLVGRTKQTPLKFPREYIRKLCMGLGLHVVAPGLREPKHADPKEMEDWAREVNALFSNYKIDPRANVQFYEFNDIRGITQKNGRTKEETI